MSRAIVLVAGLLAVNAVRTGRKADTSTDVNAGWKAVLLPGQVEMKRPAFLMLDELTKSVVVSQFGRSSKPDTIIKNPFPAASTLSRIPLSTIKSWVTSGRMTGRIGNEAHFVTDGKMLWPNKLDRVPPEFGNYIVIPDGFLPPGKSDGNIYLANSSGSIFRITPQEKGSCYHEVEWHDFNGDGFKDILTARFVKGGSLFRPTFKGDMMWYENPGPSNLLTEWKQHKITDGPDVIFKKVRYGDGFAIFASEFWAEKLTVQFVTAQGVKTSERLIDDTIGKAFAVDVTDVDGDGVDDLLVTNHQNDDKDDIKSGVWAYEIPSNLETGTFKKHLLAQNISHIRDDNPGVGSPGFAHAFYPRRGMKGYKHVLVAGDGTFDVWHLTPTSTRWVYEHTLIDIGGTTGQMLLHDFDNDGTMDVLVPDNDYWKLHVITFKQ